MISKHSYNFIYAWTTCLLILASCSKSSDGISFSEVPHIELTSFSSDTLVEFEDRLLLEIKYTDGNGDLGHSDPDVNSFFVKDSRLENEDAYYLGLLSPESGMVSIQGSLIIELNSFFILGNTEEELLDLEIYLKDRSGHQSNVIKIEDLLIVKP